MVTQSYLSRVENGTEQPNEKLIKLIALEFNVPTDWIVSGAGNPIIDKDSYDYFDRACNKEIKEGLNDEIAKFITFLYDLNLEEGVTSTGIQAILLEMKDFLELCTGDSKAPYVIAFDKIAGVIIEIFFQLKGLDVGMSRKDFNSRAWICTSTLMDALKDIENIFIDKD